MSYGTSITDAYRQAGVYTGRILKGEKPADPAGGTVNQVRVRAQSRAAKALGLDVPWFRYQPADEVIE